MCFTFITFVSLFLNHKVTITCKKNYKQPEVLKGTSESHSFTASRFQSVPRGYYC